MVFFLNAGAQQNSNAILESIIKSYKGEFNFSFSAKYRYYENLTTKVVSDSLDSYTIIHDDEFYFKIADYEIIGNDKYSVFTDHSSKQIVLGEFTEQEKKKKNFGYIENLLQTSGSSLTEFDPGDGLKGLTITYKNQQFAQTDIIYNPSSFWISKCTIRYLEKIDSKTGQYVFSRLEINYSNYIKTHKPMGTDYGLAKFVDVKNNKTYSVRERFKGYEIINLTPLKKI